MVKSSISDTDAPLYKWTFTVEQGGELFDILQKNIQDLSRNKIKSLLKHRQVLVNGILTTQYNKKVKPGDVVSIVKGKGPEKFSHPKLKIVHDDKWLVVISKSEGLLSVSTKKDNMRTAFYIVSRYVKLSDPGNRIFIVHRLDRETSGLMVLAKSEETQSAFQRDWKNIVTDRKYVAVVEGQMPAAEGSIDAPLTENKNLKMYVSKDGEPAVTHYRVITAGRDYSLVELTLETGKKNQIRAHLEHIGCPIAGDSKYAAQTNPLKRVCLHARVLNFIHPHTGVPMEFNIAEPAGFRSLCK